MLDQELFNEKLLLQKIADGSEMAFRELFDLYKAKIYSFVVHFTHSKVDAEEIVQDVFLMMWHRRASLTEIEHPRNYIYTVARHKTYDYLKRLQRDEKILHMHWQNMQLECNSTEELLDVRESMKSINEALGQLSEQKQLVFRMSRFEGKNHLEIAAVTGLSKSRVKNIIVEVIRHIKCFLELHPLIALPIMSGLIELCF